MVPDLVDTLESDVHSLRRTASDVLPGPGPGLTEEVEGYLQSPDDEQESLANWFLQPLDGLAADGLF